jgi:hypothetical protein
MKPAQNPVLADIVNDIVDLQLVTEDNKSAISELYNNDADV